jgi:hypothetical protein
MQTNHLIHYFQLVLVNHHRLHPMKLHHVQLDLLYLLVLAVPYLLFHPLLQQHLQHLVFLADQLDPEFLVYLEFLANLLDLVDQPFLLVLQFLEALRILVHLQFPENQLDPKLSLLVH